MSNPTRSRASALDPVTSTVILTPAPLLPAGRKTSLSFSVPSAFLRVLYVKSFDSLCSAPLPQLQFLFNTNEPLPNFATHRKQTTSFFPCDADRRLSRASNSAIRTKQITSSQITPLFLFNTNERSQITTHQSLITTHQSLAQAKTP